MKNKNNKRYSKESHLRSIIKGICWRIIATFTTAIVAFVVTGEVGTALKIGGIEALLKIVFYYFHERIWQMVPRGTIRSVYQGEG